jgi:tetratricopeptide (TPR) repeat protein
MIFISYRKADTQAVVDHLADRLKNVFGANGVFKDDHDLRGGEHWPDRLRQEVLAREVLLAVIGPGWLTALDEDGRRRLDDPDDWVRQEISTALERRKRVVVLLVDAAKMPTKRGLPANCPLQDLPDHQALPLRTGLDAETDLARLIEELRPALRPMTAAPSGPAAKAPPPKPPVCFGRAAQLTELLATLLPSTPVAKVPATPIVGIGGIGKSTFVLTALWDEGVWARYEERRHFVRLDGAPSRSGLVAAVAEVVGLPLGDALEARLVDFLGRGGPRLLVLDNAETPLLADDRTETEELLGQLAAIPSLAVVATLRGTYSGPGWRCPLELRRLDDESARRTFLAGTSGKFTDDPTLDDLLRELDGWSLGVTLLAYQARYYADLKELTSAWQRKRAALLTRGVKKREADLGASIEMSLSCPLLTQDGRRLLALLGILPEGVRRDDLAELLPPDGAEAAVIVRRVGGLAFDDGSRLRVLAPLREYLAASLPPQADDCERAVGFYCRLAEVEGNKVGAEGGAGAAVRLGAEAGNCVAMIQRGFRTANPEPGLRGALGLAEFSRFTGRNRSAVLHEAEQIARAVDNPRRRGDCFKGLGDIALARSDYAEARRRYEAALPLYQQVGSVRGQANCIWRLGDIALAYSEYAEARRRYEAALPLYQQVGSVLGEANCILSLGDIALARSEHAEARRRYEAALPQYQQVGDILGEANCIQSLGDIALARSEYAEAQRRYEAALPLYQQVGDVLGEANCIKSLGDLALRRSELAEARRCSEAALPLYQQVGDVLGEANCIQSLGDLALARLEHAEARRRYGSALPLYQQIGDVLGEANCIQSLATIALKEDNLADARQRYEQALTLYQRIERPYSVGWTHRHLAGITAAAERQEHVAAARAAFCSIDRPDLIAALDQEFGPPPAAAE